MLRAEMQAFTITNPPCLLNAHGGLTIAQRIYNNVDEKNQKPCIGLDGDHDKTSLADISQDRWNGRDILSHSHELGATVFSGIGR